MLKQFGLCLNFKHISFTDLGAFLCAEFDKLIELLNRINMNKRVKNLALGLLAVSSASASSSLSFASVESNSFDFGTASKAKGFQGSGEFYYNQLSKNIGEVVGNEYYGNLNLKYKNKETKLNSDKYFEFKARHNNESSFMFSVPEAYMSWEVDHSDETNSNSEGESSVDEKRTSKYYFGRVVLPWSKADENWGFGKLNNRVNFDGFSPGQEGLVGLRYVFNLNKNFKIEAFGSYFYIPELNPSLEINDENGTVKCKNPWCTPQNESAEISAGNSRKIFYDVEIPDLDTIVLNPSIGIQGEFNIELPNKMKLVFDAFYIRKPENVISTNVDVQYDPTTQLINANIDPEVYYHSVFGGNINLQVNKNLKLYATTIAIRPDESPILTGEVEDYLNIKPNKIDEEYLGGGIEFTGEKLVSSAGYIARLSKFEVTEDPLLEYPRWNQAIQLNIGAKLSKRLTVAGDVKFDTLTDDRLVMIKVSYLITSNLLTSFGVNMIGTSDDDSYWSAFDNNDALYGALKYTF